MNFPWDELLVKGNWMITMAQIKYIKPIFLWSTDVNHS